MTLSSFVSVLLIDLRLYLRNWAASFWTFVFPILLLVLLMLAFGGNGRLGVVTLEVRDRDNSARSTSYVNSLSSVLAHIEPIKFNITSAASGTNDHTILLSIPDHFGSMLDIKQAVSVDISALGPQSQSTALALSILTSVNDRLNIDSGRSVELIRLNIHRMADEKPDLPYGQYLVAGIVGMVLFSTCLFGFTLPIVSYRQSGYLKILDLLPVEKWWFFTSFVVARLIIIVVYISGFLLFAHFAYSISVTRFPVIFLEFVLLLVLGAITFLSIGLLVTRVAPTNGSALALCNLLYFCAVFTSDLFIPTKSFPEFIVTFTRCFPLQPLVVSLRGVLFLDESLSAQYSTILVLAAWTFMSLAIAVASGRNWSWLAQNRRQKIRGAI